MSIVDGDSGSWVIRDEKLCGVIFCRMGNGVEWAYMLPIEAVFRSISKTLGSFHPDWPSPEVRIAREEVSDTNENSEIITKSEDKPNFSNSESLGPKLSESKVHKKSHENSPAASTLPKIHSTIETQHTISSMKRRESDTLDDDILSATTNKSNPWASKSILSLGKNSRKLKIAERTLIRKFQMAAGCACTLVF